MDKKLFKGNIIVSIICIFSMFFCYIPTIYAKDLPAKDYLTNIRVSNTEVKNGGDVTISAQWHNRQDAPIRGGDTLTINFPEGDGVSSKGYQSSGNLTMSDGTVVGTIVVESDKAILTFNNQINQYIGQSVHGTVNCSFKIWDSHISDGSSHSVIIPVTGDKGYNPKLTIEGKKSSDGDTGYEIVSYDKPWIKKTGVKSYPDGKEAWVIDGSLGSLKDATVTDNIGQGITLIDKTIRVIITCGDSHKLTVQQFEDEGYGTVNINSNNKGFTIHFNLEALNKLAEKYNQPGVGFTITYNTQTEEPITFVGPKYLNSAIFNAKDKDNHPIHKEVVASLKNFNASWTVEGSKNALHVQKLDAETMQPVEGAVISIYNQETGKMTEGTTDSKGLVVFSNLQPGDYTLAETKAPKGYKINEQLYLFKVDKDYTVSGFKGTNGKYDMDPVVFDQKESTTPTKPSSSTSTSTTTTTKTTVTKPSKSSSTTKTTSTKPSKSSSTTKTTSTKPSKSSSTTKATSTKPSKSSSTTKATSTKPSKSSSTTKTTSTKPSNSSSTTKTTSTKPSKSSSTTKSSTTSKSSSTTKPSTTTSKSSSTTKPSTTASKSSSTTKSSTTSKSSSTTKPSTISKSSSTTKSSTTASKSSSTTKPSTISKSSSTTKSSTTTSNTAVTPRHTTSDKSSTTKSSTTTSKSSSTKSSTTTSNTAVTPRHTTSDKSSTTKSSTTTSSKKKTNNQVNSSNQGSTGGASNTATTSSTGGGTVVNHNNNDKGNNSSSDNHGWLPQTGSKKSMIPLTALGLLLVIIAITAVVYTRKRKER